MAELVRAGEMDFPAGRLVPAVDQSRSPVASIYCVQKMVPPGQPSRTCSGGGERNDGADRMGGRYRRQPAAI